MHAPGSPVVGDLAALAIARALVVVAHPDDCESWCAGTMAGLLAAGAQGSLLVCTSGDKGTDDPADTPAVVAARREAEQLAALIALGGDPARVTFARLPDGELEPTLDLRRVITRAIHAARPDVVITHDAAPPYRLHPDHRAVGRATLDAAFASARDRLMFPELAGAGLAPHVTGAAWLFATESPNLWIDIAVSLDRKIAARLAHASQGADAATLPANWRQRAAQAGEVVGLAAAEAYHRVALA